MDSKGLGTVALKTLGVYWILEMILFLKRAVMLPFFDFGADQRGIQYLEAGNAFAHVAILGGAGLLLIFRTQKILNILFTEADNVELSVPAKREYYEALAFSLLGIFIIVPVIGDLISICGWLWWLRKPSQTLLREGFLEKSQTGLITNIVQLVLGLVLILGRNGLTKIWRSGRSLSEHDAA